MLRYVLLATIFLNSIDAFSQYISGFLIKNSNDTISGFIHKNSFGLQRQICRFKTDLTASSGDFLPLEVKAFGTDSVVFRSRKEFIQRDKKIQPPAFYKLIFDGKLDLYRGSGSKYYIGMDTSEYLYLLKNKNLLYFLTRDQPDLKSEIKSLKFTDIKFSDLLTRYHNSLNLENYKSYVPPRTRSYIHVYPSIGYYIASLSTLYEQNEITFRNSYAPIIGAGMDFYPSMRAKAGKFAIELQILFTREIFQYQSFEETGTAFSAEDILYKSHVFRLPLGFKFLKAVNSKQKLYVKPGFYFQKNIPIEARSIVDISLNNNITTYFNELTYYSESYISFFIGVGAERKVSKTSKLGLDLSFMYANRENFTQSVLSLNLSYKFLTFRIND